MTIPLILLAIPSIFLGMSLGLPLGASRINDWLAPVFEEGESILHGGAAEPAYTLFGIDGVLILASVTDRGHRRRCWPGGCSASRSGRSGSLPVRSVSAS